MKKIGSYRNRRQSFANNDDDNNGDNNNNTIIPFNRQYLRKRQKKGKGLL